MSSKQNTFHELLIDNTEYKSVHTIKFPYSANKLNIINDDNAELYYSFNAQDMDGHIKWYDASHDLSDVSVGRIWFKLANPGQANIRVMSWAVI